MLNRPIVGRIAPASDHVPSAFCRKASEQFSQELSSLQVRHQQEFLECIAVRIRDLELQASRSDSSPAPTLPHPAGLHAGQDRPGTPRGSPYPLAEGLRGISASPDGPIGPPGMIDDGDSLTEVLEVKPWCHRADSVVTKASTTSDVGKTHRSLRSAIQSNQSVQMKASARARRLNGRFHLMSKTNSEAQMSHTPLQRIIASPVFDAFSFVAIIVNTVAIGMQTQHMALRAVEHMRQGTPQEAIDPVGFVVLQAVFCVIFGAELAARMACEGLLFWQGRDVWWNVLDLLVVAESVVDLLLQAAHLRAGNDLNMSLLRILRVLRVMRVVKVLRVMRFFRELRMMVVGIAGSLKNLLWIMLVLCTTFYVFGSAFTSASTAHLVSEQPPANYTDADLMLSFGTLDRSLISLFMAMSGGDDWSKYYHALQDLPGQYRLLFIFFVIFTVFALVNIVTGIFVESSLAVNTMDQEVVVHDEMDQKKKYLQSLEMVFLELDDDETGTISFAEFEKSLKEERVVAYFNALELDVTEARNLFHLLDSDGSNEVTVEEFMQGCFKLQGKSRALDIKIMHQEIKFLTEIVSRHIRNVETGTGRQRSS